MRHYHSPPDGEKQASIDLAGCSFTPIPGTRITLVLPSPEAELRLSVQLGVPGRFKAIRGEVRRNLTAGAEAFAQRNYAIGGSFYLSVSLLTTHHRWRGGWLIFLCPAGWEEKLVEYLIAARAAVVADLRKERAQYGSKS
jgi:hypothetical protein